MFNKRVLLLQTVLFYQCIQMSYVSVLSSYFLVFLMTSFLVSKLLFVILLFFILNMSLSHSSSLLYDIFHWFNIYLFYDCCIFNPICSSYSFYSNLITVDVTVFFNIFVVSHNWMPFVNVGLLYTSVFICFGISRLLKK